MTTWRWGVGTSAVVTAAFVALAGPACAQWDPVVANAPVEPFRIAGNVYYVGASDVAAYLVTTPEGHIVLDGGLPATAPMIEDGVRKLGFRVEDVRVLLNSHAHFDHAGGLAALKAASGARLFVSRGDADLVERGGLGDDLMGDSAPFPAATVDERFDDGHVVRLGGTAMTAHVTAGHTRGCTTWTTTVEEDARTLEVVFVCSVSVLPGVRLTTDPTYPGIADDYVRTFERLESLPVDVFLGAHGSFFDLHGKIERRGADPAVGPFVDPEGYRAYVRRGKDVFLRRLREQRGGA